MSQSEILARLGIDTKQVPEDLAGAKEFFRKFATESEAISGKAGSGAGANFTKGFASSLMSQGRGALAATIGFTAKGMADKLAGWLTGGTAKEWEEFGRLADENSKRIAERIRNNLSSAQLVKALERDLADAQKGEDKARAVGRGVNDGQKLSGWDAMIQASKTMLGLNAKEVEQANAIIEAESERTKIQHALAEARKKASDEEKRFLQAVRDYNYQIASAEGKKAMLGGEIANIQKEILSGTLQEDKLKEKHLELLSKDVELRSVVKEIAEATANAAEKEAKARKDALDAEDKRQKKLTSLNASNTSLQNKAAGLKDELADPSKLTIGELAAINPYEFGVGVDAGNASGKAREIQEIEKEAERRRKSGDVTGAMELGSQVGTMRNELYEKGFLKSSERGPADLSAELRETKEAIVENLKAIDETLAGKFVNE